MEENQNKKTFVLPKQCSNTSKQKIKPQKKSGKNLPKHLPEQITTNKNYLNPTRRIKKISNIRLDPMSIIDSKLFSSFNQMLLKGSKKLKWSPKEDSLLRKGIGLFGARKWKRIAAS